MFSRIRFAAGLTLLLALTISIPVFAKGGFSFVAINGPGLDEEVRATDKALTEDFFAFANFFQNKVEAPQNPGEGYEVTRYYIDGTREIAFDRLHYYPATGFVYYDGIVNGSSEYDGKWYSANPAVKTVFESTLSAATVAMPPPAQPEPALPANQTQPAASFVPTGFLIPAAVLAGLLVLLSFALRLRKPAVE